MFKTGLLGRDSRRKETDMSHKARPAGSRGMSTTRLDTSTPTSRPTRTARLPTERSVSAPQRASIASVSSGGRYSTGSIETSSKPAQPRPSAIPRSTASISNARLSLIASSRPKPSYSVKLPVLSPDLMRNNSRTELPSGRIRGFEEKCTKNGRPDSPVSPLEQDDDLVLGILPPQPSKTKKPNDLPPRLIPELQALALSSQRPVQAQPLSINPVSSPSTVYTASPSPWSASTTATTPTSWTSASPGLLQIPRSYTGNKRAQTVPIPASAKTKFPRLPVLQESKPPSLVSSRIDLRSTTPDPLLKMRKTPINSPAPTPPPRSSSVRRARSRSASAGDQDGRGPQETDVTQPPVPRLPQESPHGRRVVETDQNPSGDRLHLGSITQGHDRLQDALKHNASHRDHPVTADSRKRASEVTAESSGDASHLRTLQEPAVIDQRHARKEQAQAREVQPEKQSARSRLAKFSKMAIFGRSREASTSETQKLSKDQRKGPVAGTGHEGYRKFSHRGRKMSIGNSTAATDSESSVVSTRRRSMRTNDLQESSTSSRRGRESQSDLDDFAATRLRPVVILGGSHKGRSHTFDVHQQLGTLQNTSLDTLDSDLADYRAQPPAHFVSQTPPNTASPEKALPVSSRSTSSTVKAELHRLPQPSGKITSPTAPYPSSCNTSQSSMVPGSVAFSDASNDMYRVDPGLLERQKKKSRKLGWNFFRRKDSVSKAAPRPAERQPSHSGMPVCVASVSANRSMPYYAMVESENDASTEALGAFLEEVAGSPEFVDPEEDYDFKGPSHEEQSSLRRAPSVLLPAAPERRPSVPTETGVSDVEAEVPIFHDLTFAPVAVESLRQPRLLQVGRIPKVVPRTNQEQYKEEIEPLSQVHSRSTFASDVEEAADIHVVEKIGYAESEPFPESSEAPPSSQPELGSVIEPSNLDRQSYGHTTSIQEPVREFDLRASDITTSSSSEGFISVMGPPLIPATPAQQSSEHHAGEDDVWKEYDDFLDHVMSPTSILKPSRKPTVQDTSVSHQSSKVGTTKGKGLAILTPPPFAPIPDYTLLTPPHYPAPSPHLSEALSAEEIRLRRSRIVSALHSSFDPSSPFSLGDFISDYGRSSRDSGKTMERLSQSTTSVASPSALTFPDPPSEPRALWQSEKAAHIDDVERVRNPAKHSERSYASLMVSRWLSFGRVLFSPAHSDLNALPERHVLVIDGLGNEDWSIYCAVTYQAERAYIHDLKEKRPAPRGSRATRKSDNVPSNHRRAEVATFMSSFPFPPSFFSAVVLRFPPGMSEPVLKNVLSECKRVLAPGGYLELMLLDLDIVNMGVLTRRAVRNLKIQMSTADRGISLKPIIDNVQGILGSTGFAKLSQCVVGVPVVGRRANSTESISSSSSNRSSRHSYRRAPASPKPFRGVGQHENFSLNDLVADHSENADAKIGKMVSRTARSWWQHCFESSVIVDGNMKKSIFADKDVLTECKNRASSFKLLIAYTQKPLADVKRRTMSEPSAALPAIAGLPRSVRPARA